MVETQRYAHRFGIAAVILYCWTAFAAAGSPPAPIKIAVFPFELEDFSAANGQGSSPVEASYLGPVHGGSEAAASSIRAL